MNRNLRRKLHVFVSKLIFISGISVSNGYQARSQDFSWGGGGGGGCVLKMSEDTKL